MIKRITLVLVVVVISACAEKNSSGGQFELEIVPISEEGQTRHVKYNRITGETWWASNTTWVKIEDAEAIPRSRYQVKIVATDTSWRAIRIDKDSGNTWKNSQGTWVPFDEKINQ